MSFLKLKVSVVAVSESRLWRFVRSRSSRGRRPRSLITIASVVKFQKLMLNAFMTAAMVSGYLLCPSNYLSFLSATLLSSRLPPLLVFPVSLFSLFSCSRPICFLSESSLSYHHDSLLSRCYISLTAVWIPFAKVTLPHSRIPSVLSHLLLP